MCLLLIVDQPTDSIERIILHNRDEFAGRPFSPARVQVYPGTDLIYGVDEKAKGTWLSVDRAGNFSAVLNIRRFPPLEGRPRSRGDLPIASLRALAAGRTFSEYVKLLSLESDDYGPFNLVFSPRENPTEVFTSLDRSYRTFSTGTFSISNHLSSETWKKAKRAEEKFKSAIDARMSVPETVDTAFSVLADEEKSLDSDLPHTGHPADLERKLSSSFVSIPESNYQTVVSTVIVIPKNSGSGLATTPVLYERNHLQKTSHIVRFDEGP